jgi:lysylphosphatidylglycerol synthetase-like protein (DUF2156 family)
VEIDSAVVFVLSPTGLLAAIFIGNEMNPLNDPHAEERTRPFQFRLRLFLTAVSLPAAAIALVIFNVLSYLYSRSVESHVRRNWTGVRPWLWPEDVLGLFVLAWVLALVASGVAMFRPGNRTLKYQSRILAAVALVAIVVNAILCLGEAFHY